MKRKEEAQLRMIDHVIIFFEARKDVSAKISELQVAVDRLRVMRDGFNMTSRRFVVGLDGMTQDKHAYRKRLIELALIIVGVMVAVAKKRKKRDMMKRVLCSYSTLFRASDVRLIELCEGILHNAKQIKTLGQFGVGQETLKTFADQMELFEKAAPLNLNAKRVNGVYHSTMKKMLSEMGDLVKYGIDNMMAALKYDVDCDYALYKNARMVICRGRKRKVKLRKAINKQTGAVMHDVTVDIIQQAETLVNDFVQQEENTYKATIKIEKKGFKPLIIEQADMRLLEAIEAVLEPEDYLRTEEAVLMSRL